MDLSNIYIKVLKITDKEVRGPSAEDIFANDEMPEYALGYKRGLQSMLGVALDGRETVVASASAPILEHPEKNSLMCINYAGSDPPYTGQGLECIVVQVLVEAAKGHGCAAVWMNKSVVGAFKDVDINFLATARKQIRVHSRIPWWRRLWPRGQD